MHHFRKLAIRIIGLGVLRRKCMCCFLPFPTTETDFLGFVNPILQEFQCILQGHREVFRSQQLLVGHFVDLGANRVNTRLFRYFTVLEYRKHLRD